MNDELLKLIEDSPFRKHYYMVSIRFRNFLKNIAFFTHYNKWDEGKLDNNIDGKKWLSESTPDFQRENDKWNQQMKIKFVENLLLGAKTELLLYNLGDCESDSLILDGLQRLTAITDFLNDEIPVFGYYFSALKGDISKFNTNIIIKRYTFNSKEEAIKFYIEMNENITHSKNDIKKARDILKNIKHSQNTL